MFKNLNIMLLALLMATSLPAASENHAMQAKQKIKLFATELKSTLKANIKQGGLKQGIEVCKSLANPIAAKHSTDGWVIKRTSLKLRNVSNQPDAWELEQLKSFEAQKAKGADTAKLVATTTTESGDFRLIKAIPTGEICLKCHGQKISPDIKAVLGEHYPNDLATGFKLGDIRGAFSVTKTTRN